MPSQSDIKAIRNIVDEKLDARLKNFPTIKDIDELLDLKLNKALRGVARKKDLRAMENRIIKKINLVSSSADSRLLDLEKQANFN